jgi:hypothetical protein
MDAYGQPAARSGAQGGLTRLTPDHTAAIDTGEAVA